jgi:hypothetical protein
MEIKRGSAPLKNTPIKSDAKLRRASFWSLPEADGGQVYGEQAKQPVFVIPAKAGI